MSLTNFCTLAASSQIVSPAKETLTIGSERLMLRAETLVPCLQQSWPNYNNQNHGLSGRGTLHTSVRLRDGGLLLERFQQTKPRRTLQISWDDRITNNEFHSWKSLYNIGPVGWATCPECSPIDSLVSSYLENSPAARGYDEDQNGASRIRHWPTSTLRLGEPLLRIGLPAWQKLSLSIRFRWV